MTPCELLEAAASDGIEFRLDAEGTGARLRGSESAKAKWTPVLAARKPEVIDELSRRSRPTAAQEGELHDLAAAIYADADDAQRGFALGLLDIVAALTAYRWLVQQRKEAKA
ncbi:MAG: hypothetical protein LKM39_17140 [Chiayiivirga sp.]|nr:hypothetical protein [Chiayiivirga sp.]